MTTCLTLEVITPTLDFAFTHVGCRLDLKNLIVSRCTVFGRTARKNVSVAGSNCSLHLIEKFRLRKQ